MAASLLLPPQLLFFLLLLLLLVCYWILVGCLVGWLWQSPKADNKYLQETMSPLISVKKLSALSNCRWSRGRESKSGERTHKMPARKQFIKVLLLNCRLFCGVGSESCPFASCQSPERKEK